MTLYQNTTEGDIQIPAQMLRNISYLTDGGLGHVSALMQSRNESKINRAPNENESNYDECLSLLEKYLPEGVGDNISLRTFEGSHIVDSSFNNGQIIPEIDTSINFFSKA
jgi:hypothetical protein